MENEEPKIEDYVASIQAQILEIVNKVKEEQGVDLPVNIEVRSSEDE